MALVEALYGKGPLQKITIECSPEEAEKHLRFLDQNLGGRLLYENTSPISYRMAKLLNHWWLLGGTYG